MKVLLSAFACEPHKGSEFAVGWNWTLHLVQAGHDVTVLTRSQSRLAIEREIAAFPPTARPRFAYLDPPFITERERRGVLHVQYAIWQWRAARLARELHIRERFDRVHHVTYAGLRAPSFMGGLGIPFIFGPVGGGERAPWRLRIGYTWHGLIYDFARDVANAVVPLVPFMARTFSQAEKVYVTSPETLRLMPRCYRGKAQIELAIGTDNSGLPSKLMPAPRPHQERVRVLFAGRFVDYKGMHLGIRAFAQLLGAYPNARLSMVGEGPVKSHWQKLAARLGVAESIDWLPWQKNEEMSAVFALHDILLFPGLHESGGLVVLEAMQHGLPVVCLKLGGPGTLVNDSCGRAIDVAGKSAAQVTRELGVALIALAAPHERLAFARAASCRCVDFTWQQKLNRVYGIAS